MKPKLGFRAVNSLRNNERDDRKDWFRISNTAADETEVWLYGEIGWYGVTADDFVDQLKAIDTPKIAVRINSPGGDVVDALAIHSCLKAHPADVTTYVDSLAASAASFIALAGDRVVTARNAMWMIHDASTIAWGNAADMRKCADLLDQFSDNIADMYAEKAGGLLGDWRQLMSAETWYTGAEAVEAGLADEIAAGKSSKRQQVPDDPSTDSEDPYWDLAAMFRYGGRDKAPAPKAIDRSRQEPAQRNVDQMREAIRMIRAASTPQQVTVTTTGPATVSLTYGSDAEAEPVAVDEPVAEPAKPAEPVDDAAVVEPVAEVTDETPEPAAEPAAEPVAEDNVVVGEPDTERVALPDEPAPEVPAEPQATQPEPPADDAPRDDAGTESITDEWARAAARLTSTPSIEDELARLRETM